MSLAIHSDNWLALRDKGPVTACREPLLESHLWLSCIKGQRLPRPRAKPHSPPLGTLLWGERLPSRGLPQSSQAL